MFKFSLLALALVASLPQVSSAQAVLRTYSGIVQVGAYPVPLRLYSQSTTNFAAFSGRGVYKAPVKIGGEVLEVECAGCSGGFRENPKVGAVQLQLHIHESFNPAPGGVTAAGSGRIYPVLYEALPPIAGDMTFNLVGSGVLATNAPLSITLTPGTATARLD